MAEAASSSSSNAQILWFRFSSWREKLTAASAVSNRLTDFLNGGMGGGCCKKFLNSVPLKFHGLTLTFFIVLTCVSF